MTTTPARILITGASGVIGSRLLPVLAARHRITALTRSRPVPGAHRSVPADLTAPGLGLTPADRDRLAGEIDLIVHCAGVSGFSLDNLELFEQINVRGTRHVLDLAMRADVPVVMLSSTSAAQHYLEPDPTSQALQAYADSKRRAEELAQRCPQPVAMIRTALLLIGSAAEAADPRQQFPPVLLDSLLRGRVRRLPVSTEHWFDAIAVESLVEYTVAAIAAMSRAAESTAGVHWATAGTARLTMGDVLDACSANLDQRGKPLRIPEFTPTTEPGRGLGRLVQLGLFAPETQPFPSTMGALPGGPERVRRADLLPALAANVDLVAQGLFPAVPV
ncbi:NAD-dependent epimerase/dehydratase family protein [Crossiella cryophila]|uniref:Nucleoside-diphosphate-sugar epimerase n=1 Tax=Crossiella cryophila TaxID=43355 RepID=A0A7W7CBU1_9PSEU|nr:SDR family oxidoreductase [Crossiella cryophila]MBB4678266.1 nucleoside-diphosphate-sugar epimerase [Crossiella cryophila]